MTRKPTIEHDATSVVIHINGASVRMRPDEADTFADLVKAEAAELRRARASGPSSRRTIMLLAIAILMGMAAAWLTYGLLDPPH